MFFYFDGVKEDFEKQESILCLQENRVESFGFGKRGKKEVGDVKGKLLIL